MKKLLNIIFYVFVACAIVVVLCAGFALVNGKNSEEMKWWFEMWE